MAGYGTAHLRDPEEAVLRIEDLRVTYGTKRGGRSTPFEAVSGISIDILPRESLGLVGESGCGKSTLAAAILRIVRSTAGKIIFEANDLTRLEGDALRHARARMQMIFQDPISSLNPRKRIRSLVIEPLTIWSIGSREERWSAAVALLDEVGIDADSVADRRPHEFSGGQCQRIAIARALIMEPRLLICDEAVSALDVSIQAQVLNLLEDLRESHDLSMLFISHDLAVVKNISDRIAVMYLGKLCEVADSDIIHERPAHPYTDALLRAIPVPDPRVRPDPESHLRGELPSPTNPPSGCRFRTRCPHAQQVCAEEEPMMSRIGADHYVACHFPITSHDTT